MKSLNIAGRLGSLAPIRRAGVNGRIAFGRFNPEMVGHTNQLKQLCPTLLCCTTPKHQEEL